MLLYIDIVGRCNLQCPSCPIGNSFDKDSVGGTMPPHLLNEILRKATSEAKIEYVGLYNWTEPLLHPRIGEMIQTVKNFGTPCFISTNLNITKRLEETVTANPDFLRISVSGFTNETYQKHHTGGDIEAVKNNMRTLSNLLKKHNSSTYVQVYYLRWIGNMDDEFLMQDYAESLGFHFQADWAWFSPIEKVVSIATGQGEIEKSDLDTIAQLCRPFEKTITTAMNCRTNNQCAYLSDYIVLDCQGGVALCCGTYDQSKYTIGKYLETNWDELVKEKKSNFHCDNLCQQCQSLGLPSIGQNNAEINNLALLNTLGRYAGKLGIQLN